MTLRVLADAGIEAAGLSSKGLDAYLGQPFDTVVTVCDRAKESCPVFPGGGERLHWSFDDPAEATGSDAERAAVFERVRGEIERQIRGFVGHVASP